MKVNLFIVLYLYILFFPLSAQVPLTTTTNTLRHGDILCKVTGHVEGSRAFTRYRNIDDEVLTDAVKAIV